MKRWSAIIIFFLILTLTNNGQAIALTTNVKAESKHEVLSIADHIVVIENNVKYIPVWNAVEGMKLQLLADGMDNTFLLKKGDQWIKFSLKNNSVTNSNGGTEQIKLIKKQENIYVPIQYTAQYFGYDLKFYKPAPPAGPNKTTKAGGDVSKEQPLKPVYLTFDDGPNADINSILDALKSKNAKATFFMIEPQMRKYKDSVKRLVAEGHYPALHSVTHDKAKLYGGSPLNPAIEMERTSKTLQEITGVTSRLTRVPYGSKPYMTQAFRNGLAQHGFKMWDWNIDTLDWKYHSSNPQLILQNAIAGVNRFKNRNEPIVILMHVNKGTAAILPKLIDYLASQGYQCAAYNPLHHISVNFWHDQRL